MAHYRGVGGGNLRVVEYIESSGTQYIDTGFKPNQDTRVVMDAQLPSKPSNHAFYFGARNASPYNDSYGYFFRSSGSLVSNYGSYASAISLSSTGFTDRAYIDKNKNVLTVNAETITHAEETFQCQYTLYLFGCHQGGSLMYASSLRLYSCQIYDNGVMVRDYVPCINPDGVAGLFDKVNKKFYGNAGTGVFAVGETTGETIDRSDGVAREVIKRYRGVDNVAREVTKAYHGVNGVAREYFSSGSTMGKLAVGSSVYMNVDGVATEFLVVQQGIPDATKYDSSCDGTWLLMKNICAYAAYEADGKTSAYYLTYQGSDLDVYLNETFYNSIDNNVKSIIKSVVLQTSRASLNSSGVSVQTHETKIFALSYIEMGGSESSNYESVLEFFNGADESKRIAYDSSGNAQQQWTRSLGTNTTARIFKNDGSSGGFWNVTYTAGYRAAMIIPSETMVDSNFNVIA